jgi:mannose/cellobiose epimerase-like protein (N-acyl-D-glucosamine 2-epimerase family)
MNTTHQSSLQTWLLEQLCPYWSNRIVDPVGGYFEGLDARGYALPSPTRTLLNQARLTFAFSLATVLGGDDQLRAAADHGFAFLKKIAKPTDLGLTWPRNVDAHGQVIDPALDAYDLSFVILAMAWYHRATGSLEALELGEKAYGCVQHHLADPKHGGFFEEHPFVGKLPRRQNPHMHLLEATLAMHGATQAPVWLERASALVELFQRAFLDAETGSLGEYFDAQWQPMPGAEGALREPGHQFEWVWLLQQFMQATGRTDLNETVQRLFQFGSLHGINAAGVLKGAVLEVVDKTGAAQASSMLMWPQTEYVKACVARFDATQDPIYKSKALAHWDLMRTHFFREDGANWINQLGPDGEPLVDTTLARVFYHVVHAASELARLENTR